MIADTVPSTNEWSVYVRCSWVSRPRYHSMRNRWDRTKCGLVVSDFGIITYRILDPARVTPCKRCYP